MSTRATLRLATRGSRLARRQSTLVAEALEDRRYEVELVTVETTGDQIRDELIHRLGTTGAFVRELDERVLDGEVDGAIHSMKDMPTEQPRELVTAAVPERGPPGDVLVTPEGIGLEDLPDGASVATSSLRRGAQLRSKRPDLEVVPVRGNVDTRLEKLLAPSVQAERLERREADRERRETPERYKPTYDDGDETNEDAANDEATGETVDGESTGDGAGSTDTGAGSGGDDRTVEEWVADLSELERGALERDVETEFDAIVLAEAGLERSGLAEQVEYQPLPTTAFVPAPGQGALAVTAADDGVAREIREAIDHARSRVETGVERILLAELGGGCIAPIGIYAIVQGEYVHARVQVYDREGEESVTATRDLPIETYPEAAKEFATDLADRGAADLIEAARREADEATADSAERIEGDSTADSGTRSDADSTDADEHEGGE